MELLTVGVGVFLTLLLALSTESNLGGREATNFDCKVGEGIFGDRPVRSST